MSQKSWNSPGIQFLVLIKGKIMVWGLDACCKVALVHNAPSHTLMRSQVIKNALGRQTLTARFTRCESSSATSNVKDVLQMLGYWFSPCLPREALSSLIFINNKGTSGTPQSKVDTLQMKVKMWNARGKKKNNPPTPYLNICNVLYLARLSGKRVICICSCAGVLSRVR